MIGDIILFLKTWWKQNVTCRHKYVYKEYGRINFEECQKCGRIKNYMGQSMKKIYKKDIDKVMPILQALAEGKTIQFAATDKEWIDLDCDEDGLSLETLINSPQFYRVKPEQKYCPFKDVEEYIIEKELKDMLVSWFEDIDELSSKLTSGNVSPQGATIRNKAIKCYKFIKEYCKHSHILRDKIMNISEILKYCPKGTKLYSPIWGEVEFIEVASSNNIVIKSPDGNEVLFYCSGAYHRNGECVLFPSKDQRDWKEFKIPVKIGDSMMEKNSKYRPFANAEECWKEMLKHQPFGWVKDRNGSKFVIENVDSRGFVEVYDEGTCNFNEVFENCTFVDGLPFGAKVEEQL